ncbi:MAG: hypothetical protein ACW964_02585 [Candidatus Hodarchaeales archaeon]|jgi:ABC-type glutathione transport system ATPase component
MYTDKTIEVTDLVKTYRSKKRKGLLKSEKNEVKGLKGETFAVKRGEIFGLIGLRSGSTKIKKYNSLEENRIKASIDCITFQKLCF